MQLSLLSSIALAIAASGALAAEQPNVSATQALKLLNTLVTELETTGDVRVKLEQETPTLDAKNVIPFHNSLNVAFNRILDAFPQRTGDVAVGSFTTKQEAALCAVMPKIAEAGHHATDTLLTLPTFHNDRDAYQAEIALGSTLSNLSWQLNMLYWSFHDVGAAVKCDSDAQRTLETINNVLQKFGDNLIY